MSLRLTQGGGEPSRKVSWPQQKQQVPPLRFAPVGMTILLQGRTLFRCIYSAYYRIVIPTGAKRSGGICSAPCGSLKSFPGSDLVPQISIKPLPPTRFRNAGSQHSFVQQYQPHR